MRGTKAERETIIRIGYADDGAQVVSFYSTRRSDWRRAERAGWTETMRDGAGREYEAPAGQFRYSLRTGESVRSDGDTRAKVMRSRMAGITPVPVGESYPGKANGHGDG